MNTTLNRQPTARELLGSRRWAAIYGANMTLTETAHKAISLHQEYDEAMSRDDAFDGGEFSGPALYNELMTKLADLCGESGFMLSDVEGEMQRLCHEEDAKADCLANYE